MNFGSDNQSGASEKILQAIVAANSGAESSYGTDRWTQQAEEKLAEFFETEVQVYFVASGTAANCLALSSLVSPWELIVCHSHAHILNDELSAPEFYTGGARLLGLDLDKPKLSESGLRQYLERFDGHDPHTSTPRALSLTQLSETGSAYSLDELSALTQLAKAYDMRVHMDGARFANALVGLGCTPAEMTWKLGVDVLCLGASKNGALAAEAVVFFDKSLAKDFEFRRKRAGHLLSKGRLLGSQFCAWLEADHWRGLAEKSNAAARRIMTGIEASAFAEVIWPVDGNEVFALIDNQKIKELRDAGAIFGEWPERFLSKGIARENATLVRLVFSFNTTDQELEQFLDILS
jgi:threonine aldolase